MINALGMLEVRGMAPAVEAADAMLKSANVRLLRQWQTDPGMITLIVEGDLAACRAALDAGGAAARRIGEVISQLVIGKADPDTERLVEQMMQPPQPVAQIPVSPRSADVSASASVDASSNTGADAPTFDEGAVMALIAKSDSGLGLVELQTAFPFTGLSRRWLETQRRAGRLVKRRGRYFVAS